MYFKYLFLCVTGPKASHILLNAEDYAGTWLQCHVYNIAAIHVHSYSFKSRLFIYHEIAT